MIGNIPVYKKNDDLQLPLVHNITSGINTENLHRWM